MTGRDHIWSMSENDLQESVRKMCAALHLAVQHVHDSRRCWLPGWPDLAVIGKGILFRELKSMRGQLSPDQRHVGRLLVKAGQDWDTWTPRDLAGGRIAKELTAISPLEIVAFTAAGIEEFTV